MHAKLMIDETRVRSTQWLSRFAVALGGFLIFVGITLIGVFVFVFFVDVNLLESEKFRMLSLLVLLAIGLLDLLSGIILRRR